MTSLPVIDKQTMINSKQEQAVNENEDKHPTPQSSSKCENPDVFVRSKTPLGVLNHIGGAENTNVSGSKIIICRTINKARII